MRFPGIVAVVVLVTVVALAGCVSAPAIRESPLAAEFDEVIGKAVASMPAVPGLAVAVYARDGSYVRAFGVTDVETRTPATTATAFYIASATKPLTALALAAVAARGELDLDATLAAYAPDANFPALAQPERVTFRNLLSHTSGIENNPIAFRVAYGGEHDPRLLWSLLASSKVNAKAPLGTFAYTNTGYNIATLLTDRKLRVRWQDLLAREVFRPAGMMHTATSISAARAAGWSIAQSHAWSPDSGRAEHIYLQKTDQTMQSAGGVIMSAADARRWLELMVEDGRVGGRQVIPAAVVQSTRVPLADLDETRDGFTRRHYGLGWYVGSYRDDVMLHHFGGFAGARSHVSYLPARHAGVAVFVNDNSVAGPIVDLVAKLVYDRLAGRAEARAEFDAAVARLATEGPARFIASRNERAARPWKLTRPRAAYAGDYASVEMGTMRIRVESDILRAEIGILHAVATPYTEPDSIRVELAPGQGEVIRFEPGDSAAPAWLEFGGARFARQQ